jgi:hypothetical protein
MDPQTYVNSLFADYEENAALTDFKEEILSNLEARIASLTHKGLDEAEAFAKAAEELGDISALADEISRKKRQEVFATMYMGSTFNYLNTRRVAAYVLCGVVLGFGLITAALAWFYTDKLLAASLGTLMPFGALPIAGFVFLGLTQETAAQEPMNWKRALLYAADSAVLLCGVVVFAITYFSEIIPGSQVIYGLPPALATLIPFALPSLAFGAFLILTERDRSKPWVAAQRNNFRAQMVEQISARQSDPAAATRYGLLSGALWITAAALFALIILLGAWKFSWIALVIAIVGQMFIEFGFTRRQA